MPILEVEVVVGETDRLPSDLAARLADAAGEVFGAPAGRIWVRLRALPREQYAENGGGPPAGVLPVFVKVLKARQASPEELRREVQELTEAIAGACGRPMDNVHVVYAPKGAGRAAFGGRLVAEA
jgi:phenylpyruvate tautomerase PptA (4-oxalocrotonate tautomerase family)